MDQQGKRGNNTAVLMTMKELSKHLHISITMLRYMVEAGTIPYVQVPGLVRKRFDPVEIDKAIKSWRVDATREV